MNIGAILSLPGAPFGFMLFIATDISARLKTWQLPSADWLLTTGCFIDVQPAYVVIPMHKCSGLRSAGRITFPIVYELLVPYATCTFPA